MHRQAKHNLPTLGYEREVSAEALRRGQRRNIFTVEPDTSRRRRHQPLQRAKERRLAGAIGAEHRHQFVVTDSQ